MGNIYGKRITNWQTIFFKATQTTNGKLCSLIDLEKLYFLAVKFGDFSTFFSPLGDNKVTLSVFIIIHRENHFPEKKNKSFCRTNTRARNSFSEREFPVCEFFSIGNFLQMKNAKIFATKFINETLTAFQHPIIPLSKCEQKVRSKHRWLTLLSIHF